MIYWRLSGFIQNSTSFPSAAVRRFMKNINRVWCDVRILFHLRQPRSDSKKAHPRNSFVPSCFHYANNNKAKPSRTGGRRRGGLQSSPCSCWNVVSSINQEQSFHIMSPLEWERWRRLVVEWGGGGNVCTEAAPPGMLRCTPDPWMSGIIKISGDINPTCGSSCGKYSRIKSLAI